MIQQSVNSLTAYSKTFSLLQPCTCLNILPQYYSRDTNHPDLILNENVILPFPAFQAASEARYG